VWHVVEYPVGALLILFGAVRVVRPSALDSKPGWRNTCVGIAMTFVGVTFLVRLGSLPSGVAASVAIALYVVAFPYGRYLNSLAYLTKRHLSRR
jgi:hypothetical protein